jgi:hypothetical protein
MKRLVLNMVCGSRTLSPSGCEAGPSNPDTQLGSRANSNKANSGGALVYPLFLRDVGKYYWNNSMLIRDISVHTFDAKSTCAKVVYSPDGKMLACGCESGFVHV